MKKILFTKLFLLLTITGIYAQQLGEIDPTFNVTFGIGANGNVTGAAVQPDGKTFIVGDFTQYGNVAKNRICRLNIDGTIDTTFNSGTGFNNFVTDIKIQLDGKIIIVGFFTTYNGVSCIRICRLNPDGTLDTSFTAGTFANGGFSFSIGTTAIQTDGKIIVGGSFSTYNDVPVNKIARLNVDGSLDTTFVSTIGQFQNINLIVVQANAKILVVGQLLGSGQTGTKISRLDLDGSFDDAFNSTVTGNINDVQLQSDDKILIVGSFSNYQSIPRKNIARLNTNGTLDNTFDPGTGTDNIIDNIKLLSNGKMIISGGFSSFNGVARSRLASINADGSLDTTFDIGANANFVPGPSQNANKIVEKIAEKPNGKIIIVGKFISINSTPRGRLAQLNADGTFDTAFFSPNRVETGANAQINTMVTQPDGKILIGGEFTQYNNVTRNKIARLNADGTLDMSFDIGSGPTNGASNIAINKICLQANGKIIILGQFSKVNGVNKIASARLYSNGTLDNTFNPTAIFPLIELSNGLIQPDGKVIICGSFTTVNSISQNRIARLNTDGTLDTTFKIGTGANALIRNISFQSDGKILIAGDFTLFNSVSQGSVARLNSDGSLDNSFNVGGSGGASFVSTRFIEEQSDGKILIAGFFTSYNGTSISKFARLNADGTLDTSLQPALMTNPNNNEFGAIVNVMKTQPNGKILIGGEFTTYDGIASNGLVRINSDGTLDTTYNSLTNSAITSTNDIKIESDGKIAIAGIFTTMNGIAMNNIARFLPGTSTLSNVSYNKKSFSVYPNPSTGIFNINSNQNMENASIKVFDLNGRIIHQSKTENLDNKQLNLKNLQSGIYILNVENGGYNYSQKLVKQ